MLGGSTFGALATSMIPPSLPAHEDFDLYETKTQPDGDVTKAAALWKQNNCPHDAHASRFPNTEPYPQLIGTVVTAYQRIGVLVKPVPLNHATYYQNIGNPNEPYDMVLAGWVPDWPNGSAVIPPLFSSGQVAAALSKDDERDRVQRELLDAAGPGDRQPDHRGVRRARPDRRSTTCGARWTRRSWRRRWRSR